MSDTAHKNCQSCGMPMARDEKGGGANADGTKSGKYCSHCFHNGAFTEPNLTAMQMRDSVKAELKKRGFPGFVAAFFTRNVPKLERWSQG
jgi:hypothetical protein